MFRRGSKNRSLVARRRLMRVESLERRQVMTAYINEVMLGSTDGQLADSQYVELRGEPSAKLDAGSYLLVISDENRFNGTPGKVTGIFDLSNQQFGTNGMLVLLPQNSRHKMGKGLVDGGPSPTVLQSTSEGFGGLPGDIFTTNASSVLKSLSGSDLSVSFFLIQTDVAPKLGDDIDADDNGIVDQFLDQWTVHDSISMHDYINTGQFAYGKVAFIERFIDTDPVVTTAPTTNVIYVDGFGYAGRIGDSTGYKAIDWVAGSPRPPATGQTSQYYRFDDGFLDSPSPYSFTGREMDHLGESNFFGGVRGSVIETVINPTTGNIEVPVPGIKFLADTNNNGKRDIINYAYDPDGFAVNSELTNAFPGVTLTVIFANGENIDDEIVASLDNTLGNSNKVFSREVFNFISDSSPMRIDFDTPVRSVSIDTIAQFNSLSSTGRLEAFNSAGESLGFALSRNLMGTGAQQTIKLTFSSDVISYAVVATAENSQAFALFDDLKFSRSEAIAETDENGIFEFPRLLPDEYNIVPLTESEVVLASPIPVTPITITRYENFRLDFATQVNSAPDISAGSFTIAEDALVDTPIGTITATDVDKDQTVTYSLQDEETAPLRIDSATGDLFVRDSGLLDFETNQTVSFKVIATDSVGGASSREFTLTLTNVNEAPQIEEANFDVSEDATQGAAIGRLFAFDPEAPDVLPAYEIVGGSGMDDFEIDPSTGVIKVKTTGKIDFESSHTVTLDIAVSDHSTPPLTSRTTVTISLVDANDPPSVATEKLDALESLPIGQSLGFIEATDQDSTQKFLFSIIEGGGNSFRINEKSGELFLAAALDFETKTVYELKIQVVDDGAPPRASIKTVKIQVGNVDEPATLKVSEFTVVENSAAETVIGTLQVIDPEKATGFTFASMDDSNPGLLFGGLVKLDQTTGKLKVASNAELDTETAAKLSDRLFIYRGSDIVGEVTVKLNVTDVNEAPTINNSSVEFPKNFPSARGFVAITAEDPEQDDLSFEVTGSAAEKFYFVSSNQLAVKEAVTLDFDSTPEFEVAVKVTDSKGNSTTKEITVTQGDLPRVGTAIPDLKIPVGTPYLFQLPFRFRNPNVRSITMIGSGSGGELPKGLRFDPTTGRIIGTAVPSAASTTQVKVQITEPDGDDEFTKEEEFELTIERSEKPLLNPTNQYDVDANGRVNPLDALRIINFIAKNGNGGDAVALADVADGFYDCSGNNVITAQDALLIINQLRRTTTSSPSDSIASSGASTGATPAIAAGESTRLAAPESKSQLVDQAMLELSQGSLF